MAQLRSVTPLIPAGPDLEAGVRFFIDELGFSLTWKGGNMAGVQRGDVTFNLVQNSDIAWAENSSASIGTDDLDSLYTEYRKSSARVGALEMKAWGRREFHMILPTGVCLQFFAAAD